MTTESILSGILSGIITSCLIFIVLQLFQKRFLPWYQTIIYSGIKIAGEWTSKATDDFVQDIKLEINQSANNLEGVAIFVRKPTPINSMEQFRSFKLAGKIQDRFIHLIVINKNDNRLGLNLFLLEIVGDGRIMKGGHTYYEVSSSKVSYRSIVLSRDGGEDYDARVTEYINEVNKNVKLKKGK